MSPSPEEKNFFMSDDVMETERYIVSPVLMSKKMFT
jgi:hypothetical protein